MRRIFLVLLFLSAATLAHASGRWELLDNTVSQWVGEIRAIFQKHVEGHTTLREAIENGKKTFFGNPS